MILVSSRMLCGVIGLMVPMFPGVPEALNGAPTSDPEIAAFAKALGQLAEESRLPGLSAALVRDGELVWSQGFGKADLEHNLPATASTPHRLASATKPIAAVILMQLVEEGRLDLDAPMRDFDIHAWFEPGGGSWAHYPSRYDAAPITVRHVLTHTSQSDPPGEAYQYSGNIYADLTWVIEDVTGKSYPDVVRERIIEPLKMTRSCPGPLAPWCQNVVSAMAKPYDITSGKPVAGTYPGFGLGPDVDASPWHLDPAYRVPRATVAARKQSLGDAFTPLYSSQTAAGMIASVEDLARFDIALDGNRLISEESRREMFTATRTSKGDVLPYGLGWFVEDTGGRKVVWHYGWFPPTVSALYVKVPAQRLTMILLSNCDGLSAGVSWSAEGVRASAFARLFLQHFAHE